MGGIIIVIIIVIVFVMKSVQQKSGNSQRSTDRSENYGNSPKSGSTRYSAPAGNAKRTGSMGGYRTGSAGSSKRTGSTGGYRTAPAGSAKRTGSQDSASHDADRKKTVSRDLSEHDLTNIRMAAGIDEDDGAILSAAKINSYVTEMDNEMDSQEDLMKPVYDMMVTGPDTSLPSGRDFIAEATDMLNSFTTKGD